MSETLYPRIRIQKQPSVPRVRLRMLPSLLPLAIEMQATETAIQWRIGDGAWMDLLQRSDLTTFPGNVVIVTASSSVNVGPLDGFIFLNKSAPGATVVTLPSIASRGSMSLQIVDWAGNAGDITITPNGSDKIMGLSTAVLGSGGQGIGTAASITLYPSADLGGWYTA